MMVARPPITSSESILFLIKTIQHLSLTQQLFANTQTEWKKIHCELCNKQLFTSLLQDE